MGRGIKEVGQVNIVGKIYQATLLGDSRCNERVPVVRTCTTEVYRDLSSKVSAVQTTTMST